MKAASFDYIRPTTLDEACGLLADAAEGTRLLAGGQSLLPAMNMRLASPARLVDIARIAALRGIEINSGCLRIGAMMRQAELMAHPLVAAHAPLINIALAHVAHPAIRARGTIGGNLAHADPASELPACMLVLNATLIATSRRGVRRIEAADFFVGLFATSLAGDEILSAIEIPASPPDTVTGFVELARRRGDYAIVGAAAQARRVGGRLEDVRIAFFSVGDRPVLAVQTASALAGGAADRARAALASELAVQADLQATAETRSHLAGVALDRLVTQLLA